MIPRTEFTASKKPITIALLAACAALIPLSSQAQISISVGDQGYYTHGAYYEDGGWRYAWVPGHRDSKGKWIHGHYVRKNRVHVNVGVPLIPHWR